MTVRTRFAPSPTGYLHLGGARTALFAWLFARHHQGQFILRIEDTDVERSDAKLVESMLQALDWMGLTYDEGPYYQSKRLERYQEVVQKLLDEGHAYRCYCSQKRLEALRAEQMKLNRKPKYDGYCRHHAPEDPNQPHVIRFRNPDSGEVSFEDQIRGLVTVTNHELDDLVIMRTDGTPTYNLTVVVDDIDMTMTHVIRGDDHVNNTPRQINIIQALGHEPPVYAHVPMILGDDGKRLSKRHGAVNVLQYRDDGYLPEAVLNGLVRLGWSHGDQELFTRDEMINYFDLQQVSRAPAAFNLEKLQWMNQHYMKTLSPDYVASQLAAQYQREGIDTSQGPGLTDVVMAFCERTKTLHEMAHKSRCFFEDFESFDDKAAKKFLRPAILEPLEEIRARLSQLESWHDEALHEIIIQTAEKYGAKLGKIAQPIRVAVTGTSTSPPIDVTLRLLGKDRTLNRLDRAIEFVKMRT